MSVIISLIMGVVMGMVRSAPVEHYASRYDHLDVDTILNNRRMVNYYTACLLSKGPCPPQGIEFKRILPEALHTNCLKCTEKQKTVAYRSIKRLKKEYPKIWDQLSELWDPDGSYIRKFEASFQINGNKKQENPETTSIHPLLFVPLSNRFGGANDESDSNVVVKASSSTHLYPLPISSTSTSTVSTTHITSATSTNKPAIKTSTSKIPAVEKITKPPPKAPPITTVGANVRTTVSFGTNVVGGIARGLGNLGTRVVETGAKWANAVLSTVQAVVVRH